MNRYYCLIQSIKIEDDGFLLEVDVYRETMCCDEYQETKHIHYKNITKFDIYKCAVLLGYKGNRK